MSDTNRASVAPARPRDTSSSPPWRTAVWVLAATAAAAVLFASGLVTGYVLGAGGGAPSAASPAGDGPPPAAVDAAGPDAVDRPDAADPEAADPDAADQDAADPEAAALDACVVGSWRSVEHEESFSTDQGPVTITGLVRQLEIDADGTQTVRYDDAQASMEASGSAGSVVYDGTVVYRVSTSGGSMSFELVSTEGTITVVPAEGEPQVRDLQPGTGAVRYTCDDTRLTQEAEGFRAVYERRG